MRKIRARIRAGMRPALWLAVAITIAASPAPAPAGQLISIQLDAARLIRLPDRATTVVVGNPLIADASVQPGGLAVLTGKGYGATNLIVLDRDGAVLTEHMLVVKGPADPIVVVYRGTERETYSCTPECARRITLGDEPDYFTHTLDETVARNNQATGIGSQNSGATANVAPAPAPQPAKR